MIVVAMLTIVALPLSASTPAATALVFSTPVLLAIVARVQHLGWLRTVAFLVFVVLAIAMVLPWLPLQIIAVAVLFVGPAVGVAAVGPPLRNIDLVATGIFLGCGAIAVVTGFVTANMAASPLLVVGIGTIGVLGAYRRLGHA